MVTFSPGTAERRAAPTPKGSSVVDGRALLLHFACRATLPLGSTLRVTGSTLWSPSHDVNDSVGDHHEARDRPASSPTNSVEQREDPDRMAGGPHASSVEMVTSPEDYPVWRSRTPVVITAGGREQGGRQAHRYRYMVVMPGKGLFDGEGEDAVLDEEAEASMGGRGGGGATTTDDRGGTMPVLTWEDPFAENQEKKAGAGMDETGHASRSTSVASLARFGSDGTGYSGTASSRKELLQMPYRTLTVDVSSTSSPTFGESLEEQPWGGNSQGGDGNVEYTSDGIRIDRWNDMTDMAFWPYLEREENRKAQERGICDHDVPEGSDVDDTIMDDNTTPRRGKLFLVCYHLPVLLTRDVSTSGWTACWSESLIAKTEESGVSKTHDTIWIGTISTVPPVTSEEDKNQIRNVLEPMGCVPLFLSSNLAEGHYLGMCKQVLWPAFHNIDLLDLSTSGWGSRDIGMGGSNGGGTTKSDWDQSRLDGWWGSYTAVNQTFAETLMGLIKPNDTIWVHDYHLALLPKMLDAAERTNCAQGRRTIRMVFFLHIPFPTSQVFRELEHGGAILEGMLHADVVGFHAFDHARHFLNASKRILGLTYESLVGGLIGVRYRGTKVVVAMSNVSIEPDIVNAAMTLPSVSQNSRTIRTKNSNRSIIAGVDVAQRLSGVSLKLLAYERLLTDYPNWRHSVCLVQKCLVPGSRQADEAETLREVRALVSRIRQSFGRKVIDYEELPGSTLPLDKRLSIWTAADVLMCTPVREGLNLNPLEYVFARGREGPGGTTPGVVIASEFSAVCSVLNGALRVNPYDVPMTSSVIDKALSMNLQEREGRRARDIDFVASCPSGLWTKNVLRDLDDATLGWSNDAEDGEGDGENARKLTASQKMESIDNAELALSKETEIAFSPLDIDSVCEAYNATSNRVIVLDFNGTLLMKEPPGKYLKREILGTTGNKPPSAVINALTDLCAEPGNTVYVVSGDSQKNLEDAVGNIPGLGLAASNGACFANPLRSGETERQWCSFDLGVDWNAVKRVALPILSKYTARTNGSFVKLTHSSIGWSYYSCDPEWGSLQASYLVPELERELHSFDVRFVALKGVIEVVPRQLNKGLIVKKVLRDTTAKIPESGVDFILCMGDDISDEKMFTSVFSFVAESGSHKRKVTPYSPVIVPYRSAMPESAKQKPMYAFTVAVGKKSTHASRYVNDASDVGNVLINMSGGEMSPGRSMSWDVGDDMQTDLFA